MEASIEAIHSLMGVVSDDRTFCSKNYLFQLTCDPDLVLLNQSPHQSHNEPHVALKNILTTCNNVKDQEKLIIKKRFLLYQFR